MERKDFNVRIRSRMVWVSEMEIMEIIIADRLGLFLQIAIYNLSFACADCRAIAALRQ